MENVPVKVKTKTYILLFFAALSWCDVNANLEYMVHGGSLSYDGIRPNFVSLDHGRHRRDATVTTTTSSAPAASSTTVATSNTTAANNSNVSKLNNTTTALPAAVTQTPLLGYNGTGQRHINSSASVPKVSDPIVPDIDNINDVFRETPETIKAEQNLANVTYDNHNFYNSSFIGNLTYFNDYWANITKQKSIVHEVLSNSHRRATTIELKFDFPFYGHNVRNITVATGGFIYTGDHVHNWLAATQYIAPLMGNFDTTLTNESIVKMYDDGEKFTVFWENVTLQEDVNRTFTFAVTLYKNGDIVFAYKDIPIKVQNINDIEHPVKVGISDAYLNDKILFYVRRKTIYEYHRVSFKNYEISNNTLLKLTALPTCLQYNTCESCVTHNTGFNCMWCFNLHKCSSGTDRNKQDWVLRYCDKAHVTNVSSCPANSSVEDVHTDTDNTAYKTDTQGITYHDAVVKTVHTDEARSGAVAGAVAGVGAGTGAGAVASASARPVGGVAVAMLTVTLVACLVAWLLYAFKNPHTRSGQLLIKYRPSQWSWRRGEARYTAATIHM